MIVLDTNVLSEPFKASPSQAVAQWLAAQDPLSVFITAVTQAELLCGVEALPSGKRRFALLTAVEKALAQGFPGRVLPFDEEAARVFPKIVSGRNALGRPIAQFDAMIAAIVRSRGAILATRNTADFEHCGFRIINPWAE